MKVKLGSVVGFVLLFAGMPVWADEPSTASLRAEIDALRNQLNRLETKLAQSGSSTPAAPVGLSTLGLSGVQLSGFVDTTYTYNFDVPQTNVNTLRVFDTRANSFMLNSAELNIKKPVSAESPVGFRTDLAFGTDSEVVGSVTSGLGLGTDELDIQQAFVEYLAPIGNGLDVQVGKFVTLHGAEVIKSKDDWSISRSFLFGYAIPFTHTGIRATYPWSDKFSTVVGVNNGWDLVDDNNQGKTVELGFTAVPLEHTSLTTTYMFGAEQANNNGKQRHLLDLVAGWQPIEPLQLKLNYDYGWEDDAVAFGNNAVWQGLAAYARYALSDKWAVAVRGEYFSDADAVRTAFNAGINGKTGNHLRLTEWTLTSEYQLNPHLIARAEYRHDWASERVFRAHDVAQRSYQDTVAVEFIAPF